MTLRLALFTLALSTLPLVACGGDGPGTGPVSEEDFRSGCQVDCEHEFECDPQNATPVDQCVTECTADYANVSGWLRGDAFVAITDCFAGLACSANGNECMTECEPTSAHTAYEAQCREIFGPCVAEPADLDGICEVTPMPTEAGNDVGIFCLMTPDVIERMTACIPDGTACQAGIACIQGVLESVGFD